MSKFQKIKMVSIKNWGERFSIGLKSSLRIALLAKAEERSSQLSTELKKDYNNFSMLLQQVVLGKSDPEINEKVKEIGDRLLTNYLQKIDWLLYAGDFERAFEHINDALTISIIIDSKEKKSKFNTLKEEALIEKKYVSKTIEKAQYITEILQESPEDDKQILKALAIAVQSISDSKKLVSSFNEIKADSLKKWNEQLIQTKDGISYIMENKLYDEYKKVYKEKLGFPIKKPNIKGKGWLAYYKPGKIIYIINKEFRLALGLSFDITHEEVNESLKEFNINNLNVSKVLWDKLVG